MGDKIAELLLSWPDCSRAWKTSSSRMWECWAPLSKSSAKKYKLERRQKKHEIPIDMGKVYFLDKVKRNRLIGRFILMIVVRICRKQFFTQEQRQASTAIIPFITETFWIQLQTCVFWLRLILFKLGIFFFQKKMRKSCLKNIWISKVVRGIKLSVESDRFDIQKFFGIEKRRKHYT